MDNNETLRQLDAYLRRHIGGLGGAMRLQKASGGQSNPTYFISFDNRDLVLRKKPALDGLPPAHAVDREYRVLQALAATDFPVPRALLYCAEPHVVGTPFYVMERLVGRVFDDNAAPGIEPLHWRAVYLEMADTLAALHTVDWRAAGLADFGKPGNYFERQLRRWRQQWELSRREPIVELDELLDWLDIHLPTDDGETTICHGDFKLNNLLFHPTEPRVVAVLDWELATLGHPLADVAFNTSPWRMLPLEYGGIRGLDLDALGIPGEHEYLARYYQRAGRKDAARQAQPFHWAFAFMRWSVIFAGIAARAAQGTAAAANAAEVGPLATRFAQRGIEAIDTPVPAL